MALRASELWEEQAVVPGTGFRPHGSLTLAAEDTEAALLQEAACLPDACQRGYEFLDAAAVHAVNPALPDAFSCGLLCTRDAIVEPRQVPAAIRDYLIAGGSGRGHVWLPGGEAVDIAPGAVRDHTGTWHRGDLVILCPGAAHTGISGPHLSSYDEPPVRRVRLQMLQTEPFDRRLTTSVADGDSLRYYPGLRPARPGQARTAASGCRGRRRAAAAGTAA